METLRLNPNDQPEKKIRHAIFIEEAHNIIAQTSQQASFEAIDPKVSATAFIVKMLAEVRSQREAIIIADQLPSTLATEVLKNTNIKIIHRLTAKDDRQMVGSTISASELQLEQLTSFSEGDGLFFSEKVMKPFKIKVKKWATEDTNYVSKNDAELFDFLITESIFEFTLMKTLSDIYYHRIKPCYDSYIIIKRKLSVKIAMNEDSDSALQNMSIKDCNTYLKELSEKAVTLEKKLDYICDHYKIKFPFENISREYFKIMNHE